MQTFRHLNLPTTLDTSRHDITREFFAPLLSCATRYDRGVGFFSSGWLRMNAVGMSAFAAQNGHARWITSPILSLEDWQAMLSGNHARRNEVLRQTLERTITKLTHDLESQTLSALAWLVADRILDFRLAVPVNDLTGEFHSKFGIFTDNVGDVVSFEGSYNDSIQGTRNYESLKIFRSWEPYQADMVQHDSTRFERLWCDEDPNVRVYDLPEAARQHILKLRTEERPYPTPRRVEEQRELYTVQAQPHVPTDLYVRDYQEEAIRAWFEHACQGILEMATGTGKTITALTASARLYKQEGRLAVIIAVPYQHLVDQWNEEATAFGYESVLAYQSKTRWLDELNSKIIDFNAGYRHFISVIVTHTTFGSPEFQNSVKRLNGPTLLIADEVHHLGAERSRQNYPEHVAFRLALSATPDRWFDDTGTVALRDYFGETIFTFSLEQAIGTSLTPYYYHPHLVPLTDEELEGYEALSAKIARLIHREDDAGQQALKMLLIRRTELLNKAKNKLVALSDLVDAQGHIEHTLFYCAPGQIDEVLRLLGWEKGLLVHRFTAEEDPHERQQLLTSFASGDLQGLVAMKCLDEGVDVPSTRTAFFLASSSNPREFIQRRGRILRQAPGKRFSSIHDLIAVPPTIWSAAPSSQTFEVERNIVRRELERFKEFANPALNKHQALDVVWDIAKRYGLMDF